MFRAITLRGTHGTVALGYRDAARLRSWVVTRTGEGLGVEWLLRALVERADTFQLRQTPLQFTAPRHEQPAGLWCWPIHPGSVQIAGDVLTARLGPPEG